MKKIALILTILIFAFSSSGIAAQRLVCSPAPENADQNPDNDVVKVVVTQGAAQTVSPYRMVAGTQLVELLVLTGDEAGEYQFQFENSQGRRSDPVTFNLHGAPAGCSGIQIYND